MRRTIAMAVVLVLCFVFACPVFATEFVPSIGDKNAPELVTTTDEDGNVVIGHVVDKDGNVMDNIHEHCLVVTPVSQAKTSTLIPDDAEEMLLYVYGELKEEDMQIPYEKFNANLDPDKMVIRDLFDASWLCEEHPEMVAPAGVYVKLTFNLGISADTDIYVATYKNHEWNPIVSTTNNGDGTVTCLFEDFCPISFSVPIGSDTPPAQTGDSADITLWIVLMAVSAVALCAVVVFTKTKKAA